MITGYPPSGTGSGDLKVYLADVESEKLRKYARLFLEYRATNSWSPPELLDPRRLSE